MSEPELQNIPIKRTSLVERIQRSLIGKRLVLNLDYASLELRVLCRADEMKSGGDQNFALKYGIVTGKGNLLGKFINPKILKQQARVKFEDCAEFLKVRTDGNKEES